MLLTLSLWEWAWTSTLHGNTRWVEKLRSVPAFVKSIKKSASSLEMALTCMFAYMCALCFALSSPKGWTDTHVHTLSNTWNNAAGITYVDRDTCTHTQFRLLFLIPCLFGVLSRLLKSSQMSIHFSAHLYLKLVQIAWQPVRPVLSPARSALPSALYSWLFQPSVPLVAVSAPKQLVFQPNLCPPPSPLSPWPAWNEHISFLYIWSSSCFPPSLHL